MVKVSDFFSFKNSVNHLSDEDMLKPANYLESLKAFARLSNQSIYVIDYEKKGFEFVSDNPLLLCGLEPKDLMEMGYEFYLKHVVPEDLELLLKINQIGFDLYETLPVEDRLDYSISYDFRLKNSYNNSILINQKLTPLFLNEEGKVWKALCLVSLSNESTSGNIRVYKGVNELIHEYDLESDFWKSPEEVVLTSREKELLQLSVRGYSVKQIADKMSVSSNTVKYHRKNLFEKLDAGNISEAITIARNSRMI